MTPTTTAPSMPMGQAASLPLTAADLMPPIKGPGAGAPPPAAQGIMAGPGGTPLGTPDGAFPSPDAPAEAPYDVQKQADGSAVWLSKTNPPVVIGVIPAPKIPASLQPAQ